MLTMQIPMLLALLGTALMAVVIFAPSRAPATVTTSFAPPPLPPAVERWEPSPAIDCWEPLAAEPPDTSTWPALIDPRAAGCDAAARLALVEALAAVRSPWSETILRRALDDESDRSVRDAVVAALGA
jgi:hypothetical protein